MADWRERGYVPDSDDDEEDCLTTASSLLHKAVSSAQHKGAEGNIGGSTATSPPVTPSELNIEARIESTAKQLDLALSQGLRTIQDVFSASDHGNNGQDIQAEDDDSPLSSLPSSLGSSPLLQPISTPLSASTTDNVLQDSIKSVNSIHVTVGRNLRMRNPIQMHPYMLEDAKYRTLMKARGLRPVNLPRYLLQPELDSLPEADSQIPESGDTSALELGAEASFVVPSSPLTQLEDDESQSPIARARRVPFAIDYDTDEDLPELSEILHESNHPREHESPAMRHRSKGVLRGLRVTRDSDATPLLRRDRDGNSKPRPAAIDEFHVPLSPPWSSSTETFQGPNLNDQARTENLATPAGLPTPLVSSEISSKKRSSRVLSKTTSTSSSPTSSDESEVDEKRNDTQRIQVMTRKIRGVLPASWLKLDMRKKTESAGQKKPQQAPASLYDDRGVAQRIDSRAKPITPADRTKNQYSFDFGDDESDIEDVETPNVIAAGIDFSMIKPQSAYQGEAEEDNAIDYMLPPQPRVRNIKQSRRKKQERLDDKWPISTTIGQRCTIPAARNLTNRRNGNESHRGSRKRHKTRKTRDDSMFMSVLDAPMLQSVAENSQPRFLKLAARQVRRSGHRKSHRMTTKFFKLSTTQETNEVAEAIDSWKSGTKGGLIRPNLNEDSINLPNAALSETTASKEIRAAIASADHSRNLRALKTSTDTLLQRLTGHGRSSPQTKLNKGQIPEKHFEITNPFGATSSKSLNLMLPRQNRSGQGHLLSITNIARPAQLETEVKSSLLATTAISRKIPQKSLPHTFRKGQTKPGVHVLGLPWSNAGKKQDQIVEVNQSFPVSAMKNATFRGPRKQKPQPNHLHTRLSPQALVPAVQVYDRSDINESFDFPADEDLSGTDLDQLLHAAIKQMQHMLLSKPATHHSEDSFARKALKQVVDRAAITHISMEEGSGQSTTMGHVLSTTTTTIEATPYNAKAFEVVGEAQLSLRGIFQNWDYKCSSVIKGVEQLITLTEESLYFVDPKSTNIHQPYSLNPFVASSTSIFDVKEEGNGRTHHIRVSIGFIEGILDAIRLKKFDATSSQYRMTITLLSRLAIYSVQMYNLAAENWSLQQSIKTTLISILQYMLGEVLKWSSIKVHLSFQDTTDMWVLSRTDDGHTSGASAATECVLIASQTYALLDFDGGMAGFYNLLADSITPSTPSNPVIDLCNRLATLSYIFDCLESSGPETCLRDASHIPYESNGWNIFVSLIPKVIALMRSAESAATLSSCREYMHAVTSFIFRFSSQWQWKATPFLAKTLLEIYSFNDMIPFEFKGSVESIFYDHHVIDRVPSYQENDFDRFLDLVRDAIESQRMLNQDAFDPKSSSRELRGLIYSLIPNNARLYDAREALSAEPFLGLKDHFSLYIVLYKNSPRDFGPRIQQLEQQVDLEYSHSIVCKLALKVWETVALFETKRLPESAGTLADVLTWLSSILTQLVKRYETGQLDAGSLYGEALNGLKTCIDALPSPGLVRDLLLPVMANIKLALPPNTRFGPRATKAALNMLMSCAHKMERIQQSRDDVENILSVIKSSLQSVLAGEMVVVEVLKTVTMSWFSIARVAIKWTARTWLDFIEPRSPLSIDKLGNIDGGPSSDLSKTFFFTKLIENEQDVIFLEHRPLIFTNWVIALLSPSIQNEYVNALTKAIVAYAGDSLQLPTLGQHLRSRIQGTEDVRFIVLQHIIQNVYVQQDDPESEWLAGGLEGQDLLDLSRMMSETMKKTWKALREDPAMQNAYTSFVVAVINEMEVYPLQGMRSDPWFSDGREFPRASQTFDGIFRCRFKEEGGEVLKSSIVTFRLKSLEAFSFGKQTELTAELSRVFCCTDTLRVNVDQHGVLKYSVDLSKQTRFLQIVAPSYIDQTCMLACALVALPLLKCLCHVTANIFFRIDNLEPERMEAFVLMSITCLVSVSRALETKEDTPATSVLLEYATVAVRTIWSLTDEDNLSESIHEMLVTTIFSIVDTACSKLSGVDIDEMSILARQFSALCPYRDIHLPIDQNESELRNFASRDLREGLERMPDIRKSDYDVDVDEIQSNARAFLVLVQSLLPMTGGDDMIED